MEGLLSALNNFRREFEHYAEEQADELKELKERVARMERKNRSRSRSRSRSRTPVRKRKELDEPSKFSVHTFINNRFDGLSTSAEYRERLKGIFSAYGAVESVMVDEKKQQWAKITFEESQSQRDCLNAKEVLKDKYGLNVRVHMNKKTREDGEI